MAKIPVTMKGESQVRKMHQQAPSVEVNSIMEAIKQVGIKIDTIPASASETMTMYCNAHGRMEHPESEAGVMAAVRHYYTNYDQVFAAARAKVRAKTGDHREKCISKAGHDFLQAVYHYKVEQQVSKTGVQLYYKR